MHSAKPLSGNPMLIQVPFARHIDIQAVPINAEAVWIQSVQ
jgi:hypothetical protein